MASNTFGYSFDQGNSPASYGQGSGNGSYGGMGPAANRTLPLNTLFGGTRSNYGSSPMSAGQGMQPMNNFAGGTQGFNEGGMSGNAPVNYLGPPTPAPSNGGLFGQGGGFQTGGGIPNSSFADNGTRMNWNSGNPFSIQRDGYSDNGNPLSMYSTGTPPYYNGRG